MKRAMLFLLLAFAFAACQDSPITAPTDGPQVAAAKDCNDPKWQDHPACAGGNGDEATYDATDLGTLPGRKNSSRARDLNEPGLAGDPLLIAGMSESEGADTAAVVWTVTAAGVSLDVLPVSTGFSGGSAYGINDQGTSISGYADTSVNGDLVRLPARWDWNGSWQMTPLDPLAGYRMGISLNVNNQGQAVGWSTAGNNTIPLRVATLWSSNGTATQLVSPLGGVSRARDINNQGYIIGESWAQADAHPHAMLWLPSGIHCDLHLGDPQGMEPSRAHRITNVFTEGGTDAILVAGHEGNHARVWKYEASQDSCDFLNSWTMSIESRAIDVRVVPGGWEATVNDPSTPFGVPIVWRSSGEHTMLADQGVAIGINNAGQIAGRTRAKGAEHAMLWTPNP